MNIPDEVIEQATVQMYEARPLDLDQEDDEWDTLPDDWKEEWREGARVVAEVIAEWARKEALREAAASIKAEIERLELVRGTYSKAQRHALGLVWAQLRSESGVRS